ncbi:MAG: hypothetical protein AAFV71_28715 [Cyanobacteria bacterium J06633_8]
MAEKPRKSNFLLLTFYFLLPRSGTSPGDNLASESVPDLIGHVQLERGNVRTSRIPRQLASTDDKAFVGGMNDLKQMLSITSSPGFRCSFNQHSPQKNPQLS